MNNVPNYSIPNLLLIASILIGLIYVTQRTASPASLSSLHSFFSDPPPQNHNHSSNNYGPKDELDEALSKASMSDKTLIIAVVNKAYVEQISYAYPSMLDLFLEGFWVGEDTRSLLDHLLIVAVDQTAYDRCRFRRLNCYKLVTMEEDGGSAGEKMYMSSEFLKMMWRRTLFLLDVLKRGYNFIFTDTDVLWLRNPFTQLKGNNTEELQISTDHFIGDPLSEKNNINTGFYYVKSNNKTISLFEQWYGRKDNSTGMKEQDVLSYMIHHGALGELGLRARFLDTLHFSGFCNDSRDARVVKTVHANCCRSIIAKVTDLVVVLGDWNKFKGSISGDQGKKEGGNGTETFQWTKHNACINSWKVPATT